MDIIFTFIVVFLLLIFWHYFFKVPSYQVRISPSGLRKIPKLLLKLAKIEKDGNVTRSFFTRGLENTFKLKKLSDVVEGHKNELGYDQAYFLFTSYDQEHHSGSNFNFLIHR